ncbi:MAG TPA: hypothetical protein VGR16_00760 [Thermomicrobiales bacterium]|nr:hypothetical protein [Thermomicrobiales bacterium]
MTLPPENRPGQPADYEAGIDNAGRSSLIYCGFCGALNPASNHYCAACGSTLVDAFHASEGLRVFERPDSASRLIEIVASGTELEIVEDADAPEDFVRIRLPHGRLGYIRLQEVETLAGTGAILSDRNQPNINTNARGCVTPSAAAGALALLLVTGTLGMFLILRSDSPDAGILAGIFCLAVAPFLLLTIGLYLYARNREERLEEPE